MRAIATTVTAAEAARRTDASVVPVVLARPERPFGIAAGEIMGAVRPVELAEAVADGRVPADSPVVDHLDAPLPTVGYSAARARRWTAARTRSTKASGASSGVK